MLLTILLILFVFFAVVVIVGGLLKYWQHERLALLWTLGVAAEKGIPLEQAAAAFSREHAGVVGRQAWYLAEYLEGGMQLPMAIDASHLAVSMDARIAVEVGHRTGELGTSIRNSILLQGDDVQAIANQLTERLLYLLLVSMTVFGILMFVMVKIVPVFQRLFEDFALPLPDSTRMLIDCSRLFVNYWYLFVPLFFLLTIPIIASVLSLFGWLRWDLPLLSRCARRLDSGRLLRSLAQAVTCKHSIADMLSFLENRYPKRWVRHRLRSVRSELENGGNIWDGLARSRLLRAADAAVLKSATKVGNLQWALEEMAESNVRHHAYKTQLALQTLLPLLVLPLGFAVMIVVVSLFLPIVHLIQGLPQ